jgi:predicted RNA-binding protein with TRAM domain
MRLLEQGTVEKIAPDAPVEVGQELELKLGEVGLHDARAGVGKVKGYEVVVAEAAKLVGKKVNVRVAAVMEGVAYAVQAGTADDSQPITAEAEAERPTRAKRPAKSAELVDAVEDEEEIGEAEAVDEAVENDKAPVPATRPSRRAPAKKQPVEAAVEEETGAEPPEKPAPKRARTRRPAAAAVEDMPGAEVESQGGQAEDRQDETVDGDAPTTPRKRTRRGTRGGRGRKRKPATVGTAEENGEGALPEETEIPSTPAIVEQVVEEHATPVIHLPDRDLGANGDEPGEGETSATPRKRTRRGTRGGRGRKPKPAAVGAGEESGTVEVTTPEGEGDWQYTPMSEWDDI